MLDYQHNYDYDKLIAKSWKESLEIQKVATDKAATEKTKKRIWFSFALALVLTALSYLATYVIFGEFNFNWLEAFAVATSYSCTWLCVVQARFNYLIGAVSTLLFSILFYQYELYALAAFNGYLFFSLAYGWVRWGKDSNARKVTKLKFDRWLGGYALMGILIATAFVLVSYWFGVPFLVADIIVTALSGVAQLLLDNKRLENWIVWAVVNVISIGLFWKQHLFLTMIQYVLFLGNTVIGYLAWKKTL